MKFMLMAKIDEIAWQKLERGEMEQRIATYGRFAKELKSSGAFVEAYRPQPSQFAKTVRVHNGERQVVDGPHEHAREQLSGLYIIEAADMNAALEWAARCPATGYGLVEVRPIGSPPVQGE